jgi:predicted AlkP superfamily phosphohydrolase/phosphomutase
METLQFEAVKVALKQDATGYVLTLKVHPDEIPDELMRDFVGTRYVIVAARLNDDETPVIVSNRVTRAGMLCRDARFHQWLDSKDFEAKHTEQSATNWLHDRCEIDSRTELNGNKIAQIKFDNIVKEFEGSKYYESF